MRRTYGKDPLYGLLLTFGAAMVIEEAIRLIWGTRDYVLQVPQAISGGFHLPGSDLVDLPLLCGRHCRRDHRAGLAGDREDAVTARSIKAGAHDSEIVRALGINLSRLRLAVFVFGTDAGRRRRHHRRADLGHPSAYGRRCGRSRRFW